MSTPRPTWSADDDPAPDVEVDWAALPDDWRTRSHTLRLAGETAADYSNRVRAKVAEGLIPPGNLAFADHLEGGG